MTKDDDVNDIKTAEKAPDETKTAEFDEALRSDDADVAVDEFEDYDARTAERPTRSLPRRLLLPVALAVLLLASVGVTTWFYLEQFRPDQQTGDAEKATVVRAATEGTASLLSYSPDTLDKDFSTAKTHLTGDFLSYYTKFTQDIVTPAAKQKSVKTSAAIVQSAVVEMHPGSAVVLLYLNQTTTSNDNPDGSFTASSVKVGLTKVGNDWLISSFDPV